MNAAMNGAFQPPRVSLLNARSPYRPAPRSDRKPTPRLSLGKRRAFDVWETILSIDVVDHATAGWIDEVDPVVAVVIAVAADRRTPVGRDFAELDVGRHGGADCVTLLHGSARHLFLDDVFLDAGAL